MSIDERHLIGPPLTAEYQQPPYQSWSSFFYDPSRPIFTTLAIDAMLQDPRVILGLALRTGPIKKNSRFYVNCDNPEIKQYIADQINRFWRNSIDIALASQEYGYQPSEIIYRNASGVLQFDRLKHVHPQDAMPVTLKGQLVGMLCKGIENRSTPLYIGAPKVFWSVHNKKRNRWFGDSILRGAFPPWYEKWATRGYRDQRQTWFYKYSYQGPVLYYPKGSEAPTSSQNGPFPGNLGQARPIDNALIARKMVDAYTAGAGITLPRSMNPAGVPDWELIPPQSQPAPTGLLEYGHDLNDEIWEGLEIPPEIARSGGGSAGAGGISIGGQGGRDIPQEAFFSILQGTTQNTITDFDEQIISFLVKHRYGPDIDYEIECFGLMKDEQQPPPSPDFSGEEEMGDGGQFGSEENSGGSPLSQKKNGGNPQTMSDEELLTYSGVCLSGTLTEKQLARLRKNSGFTFSLKRSA